MRTKEEKRVPFSFFIKLHTKDSITAIIQQGHIKFDKTLAKRRQKNLKHTALHGLKKMKAIIFGTKSPNNRKDLKRDDVMLYYNKKEMCMIWNASSSSVKLLFSQVAPGWVALGSLVEQLRMCFGVAASHWCSFLADWLLHRAVPRLGGYLAKWLPPPPLSCSSGKRLPWL